MVLCRYLATQTKQQYAHRKCAIQVGHTGRIDRPKSNIFVYCVKYKRVRFMSRSAEGKNETFLSRPRRDVHLKPATGSS